MCVSLFMADHVMLDRRSSGVCERHQRPVTKAHKTEDDRERDAAQCDSGAVRAHKSYVVTVRWVASPSFGQPQSLRAAALGQARYVPSLYSASRAYRTSRHVRWDVCYCGHASPHIAAAFPSTVRAALLQSAIHEDGNSRDGENLLSDTAKELQRKPTSPSRSHHD
jgi:hypothetical protein